MKNIIFLLILVFGFVASASAVLTVDSLVWLNYQNTTVTNTALTFGNQFFVERAYIGIRGDIGKDPLGSTIKARLTLDLAKATPVKLAYVDYNLLGLDVAVLSAGIIKTHFGNIGFWEFQIPVKDAVEQYADTTISFPGATAAITNKNTYYGPKFSPSADFGVSIAGKFLPIEGLTKNLIFYDIELLNGEGYDTLFTDKSYNNNQFALQGSLFLVPIDNTRIGGSYRVYDSLNSIGQLQQITGWALSAAVNGALDIPVYFAFEYLNQTVTTSSVPTNTSYSQNVVSATLGYGLFDKILTPYIRYDIVNANSELTNQISLSGGATTQKLYQYSVLYAGFDFVPTPNLVIKPFYWLNLTDNSYAIKIQAEYKINITF